MRINARIAAIALMAAMGAAGQIDTGVVEKYRADLAKQGSDPAMKRQGGTLPLDWPYELPDGVTTRQVTFYSDGTACYAKLFFPKGFQATGKTPAVVLGHGFNAISIGIEKYGARFAARGLVAMVIDYRTYGFSSGQITLLEPDTSTDARPVTEKVMRVRIKRTRLHVGRQAEDYRAAISYIQGEPGVDRDRIGIWGSSNSGGLVVTIAGEDARVRAAVAQVIGVGGRNQTGPAAMSPALVKDAIERARFGQGAEVDGGFSFRTKIDLETSQIQREHRPWAALEHIPETTAILWMPAEKDELAPPRSPSGPAEAAKVFKGISQVIELPSITHFQAYSNAAFEVGSTLAADWFLKYLAAPLPPASKEVRAKQSLPALSTRGAVPFSMPAGVTAKDVQFYSEGVLCYGRLFLPSGFSADGKAPAVVLAPGWGDTHAAIDSYGAQFAARGLVAMTIDYRSWGKSGGYLYTVDWTQQDDRFRFMQQTANIRARRKRLLPKDQVEDIRNAISYVSGEPGVDAARVGLWGVDIAGGHAMVVAATDIRVKTFVAMTPVIDGVDAPEKAEKPTGVLLEEWIRVARQGLTAAAPGLAPETRLALAEYHPFHALKQIPAADAVLFITAEKDSTVDNNRNAVAASKVLKGPAEVTTIPGATHTMSGGAAVAAANAAAEWFLKHL